MLQTIDTVVERISEALKYLAAILLLLIAGLITTDVVMRSLLNKPIIGIAEIVANGIVIIAYLQLSYTVRIGAMLRSELLINWLWPRGKIVLETVIAILGIGLFSLIAWSSYAPMMRAISTSEFEGHASFQLPTWPLLVIIVSCSIFAVVNYVLLAVKAVLKGETAHTSHEVPADESSKVGAH